MKISLCIPTNGIVEWISQVIDSIYAQNVPHEQFEVVIADNGNNHAFYDYIHNKMEEYPNIRYKRIECPIFMNEIEAYKMAEGDFIKFVNHRTVLVEGTLEKWISFMEENYETKPIIYYANGALDEYYTARSFDTFDEFVRALSYYSSWSTGMAMWREDIVDLDNSTVNELFPHTSILFKVRGKRHFIVDNRIYLQEVPHTAKKKGRYDLFYAFAVEYLTLLLDLYRGGDIQVETFLKLKEENLDFIIDNYRAFCIENVECSYDLSSYDTSINIFYSHGAVLDRIKEKERLFQEELETRMNRLKNRSNAIAVYGAGKVGREFVMGNGKDNIVCFVDGDESKQGKLVLGIPVISYEDFWEKSINAKIIICIKKEIFCKEEKELKTAGVNYSYWIA